ncbi:MAG: hypothetical protein KAI17_19150, partial [Thiotrichaceae bacterium]|nr:hypothetical protein [Thiotrichaceae bacterium]
SAAFVCFKSYRLVELNVYFKMLAKHESPVSGTIDYPNPLTIAYVDEKIQLISSLSGFKNLKLAAEYHQLDTIKHINERAEQLLAQFNCSHISHELPAFMTNLEKVLLLIARALMPEPDILFIEKPFLGLDMHEHNILGDHLISLVTDMNLTVVSSDTTLTFTEKAAQHIIYCDNNEFYYYNQWDSFKKRHTELFDAL